MFVCHLRVCCHGQRINLAAGHSGPCSLAAERSPLRACVLLRNAYPFRRAIQRATQGQSGQLRGIVLGTEMGGDDMLELAGIQLPQDMRRSVIVQMAEPAADAFFKRPGIRPVHQHIQIVVAFQHQCVAAAQHMLDMRRGDAGIGQHAQLARAIAQHVLHRLPGVMRDGKRLDVQVADGERGMAVYDMQGEGRLPGQVALHHGEGAMRHPHRHPVFIGQLEHAAGMVIVLMRHQDAGQLFWSDGQAFQPHHRIAQAEAAVQQQACGVFLDQQPVAVAAAAYGRESHYGQTAMCMGGLISAARTAG